MNILCSHQQEDKYYISGEGGGVYLNPCLQQESLINTFIRMWTSD